MLLCYHGRKDRYNKKTLKYYVTYNEGDSDNDQQIDTEKHEEQEMVPGLTSIDKLCCPNCMRSPM